MNAIRRVYHALMLCALVATVFPTLSQAEVVFHHTFDNLDGNTIPLVGNLPNNQFGIRTGAHASNAEQPRRHDLDSGNVGRLNNVNTLQQLTPISSTALDGTVFSADIMVWSSSAQQRVQTFTATELGVPLMSFGYSVQGELLVNGSSTGHVVAGLNEAFRRLEWHKFTVEFHANDWELTIQQYQPGSGQYESPLSLVTVTDPTGLPSGNLNSYIFPYLNSGTTITSIDLDGDANDNGGSLAFYDNFSWEGTPVLLEPPKLLVDRATGRMSLVNNGNAPLGLLGYSILSANGALDQSGWTTVSGNYDANPANGGTGDGTLDLDDKWTRLTASGVTTDLSEALLTGGDGGVLAIGQSLDLGTPWIANPFAPSDLTAQLLLVDGTVNAIDVEFTGAPIVLGDIAGSTIGSGSNGTIDVVDWLEFRASQNTDLSSLSRAQAYQRGDLDGNMTNDLYDFILFARAYDLANGAGTFRAMVAAVPEPGTLALLLVGVVAACVFRSSGCRRGRTGSALAAARPLACVAVVTAIFLSHGLAKQSQAAGALALYDAGLAGQGPADLNPVLQGWTTIDIRTTGELGVTANAGPVRPDGTTGFNAWQINDNLTDSDADGPHYRTELSQNDINKMYHDGWVFETRVRIVETSGFSSWGFNPATMQDPGWGLPTRRRVGLSIQRVAEDNSANIVPTHGSAVNLGPDSADQYHTIRAVGAAGTSAYEFFIDEVSYGMFDIANGVGQELSDNHVGFQAGSSALTGLVTNWNLVSLKTMDVPELSLRIDKSTGAVSIVNTGATGVGGVGFNAYAIVSAGGAMDIASWNSLQDIDLEGNGVPNDGIGWEQFDQSSSSYLSEALLTGFSSLDLGQSISLGTVFDTSVFGAGADGDLQFTYVDGNGVVRSGQVNYYDTTALPGDFNGDLVVDARDFVVWRNHFGAADESALGGNGNGTNGVDIGDYQLWKSRFGDTAGSGAGSVVAAAVPEPSTFVLISLIGLVGLLPLRRKGAPHLKLPRLSFLVVVAVGMLSLPAFASQVDRDYRLGDDAFEPATTGEIVGSSSGGATYDSAGTGGAGDLQDLSVNGQPSYVSVADRPGAGALELGAVFNSATFDSLSTGRSMNAPSQMWNNPSFFPGPPPQIFPHNYQGIFSHGIQLWAKPDQSKLGSGPQTLIMDTPEHGIAITATGNWQLLYDKVRIDSGISVGSTLNNEGWVHVMQLAGFADGVQGASASGGVLLVNGVAVAAHGTVYDPSAAELILGAESDGQGGHRNYYDGVLDDVELFFWGNNSNQLGQDSLPGGANTDTAANGGLNADGQNWGPLNLTVDNEWIALQLADRGVTHIADVNLDGSLSGDGTGAPGVDDVSAFVAGWRSSTVVNGIQVGDWNSRLNGDLNFDGITDLADAFILNDALLSSGQAGLNFSLLTGGGDTVPEPVSLALALGAILAIAGCRRWSKTPRGQGA